MTKKDPYSLQLKFNSKNKRHLAALSYLENVGPRQKTNFLVLAVEYYMSCHSSGIDYNELIALGKNTERCSFTPQFSIQENQKKAVENAIKPDKDMDSEIKGIDDFASFFQIEE